MKKRNLLRLAMAVCAVPSMAVLTAHAQGPNWAHGNVAVLSASRPADSRGETVYEVRKQGDEDQLAVAGAFTPPVPLKRNIFPEYPESMRRAKQDGAVVVEGIVAQDGRFIDLKVFKTSDPAFNRNAMKAAAEYAFQSATLDGKPVACLLRVQMTFNIYR
jgi:TonB family protein